MLEASGLGDYFSSAAHADRCPDFVHKADVVPVRHGRWVKENGYVECSECNTIGSKQWKCCPVCTARMDLEELLLWDRLMER